MNKTVISYNLKEVCAWSVNHARGVHRYVEVVTTECDVDTGEVMGEARTQILELPLDAAVSLCASMATDETLNNLLLFTPGGWVRRSGGLSLPGFAQRLALTTTLNRTAWLDNPSLKYVDIRVDMRDGNWNIVSPDQPELAMGRVFAMCNIKPEILDQYAPEYQEERAYGVCSSCEEPISSEDEAVVQDDGSYVCPECADNLATDNAEEEQP